jgi:hypothetical protein
MSYEVRTVEPSIAADVLKRLWAANLPATGDLDEKLRWFYREGPHGAGRAFIIDSATEPVGCTGLGVRTFISGCHTSHRVGLFADLAIERRHRSALPALALVRSVRDEIAHGFDLGYGFPNAKAVAVYRRAGYELLGEMPRYVRVLKTEPYLRQRFRGDVAHVAATVIDRVLASLTHLAAAPAKRAYELRFGVELDHKFDLLWRAASLTLPFACERTSAFLRWRFQRKLDERYGIVGLYTRTDELQAYAVIRACEDGTLRIADLFGFDSWVLFALLVQLVDAATAAGATSVAFRFLGDPRIPRLLKALGFSRRSETRAVVVAPGRVARDDLRDIARWYLTDLDEDS